jgi:hypothetical protein
MLSYSIEQIAIDHPALLSGDLLACTVARCRRFGKSPWKFGIDCNRLQTAGTCAKMCGLEWKPFSESEANKAEKSFDRLRVTENAAIGACAASFAALAEGEITEVTQRGTGVDYWVDNKRAMLEISGIEDGTRADSSGRHAAKTNQLKRGKLFTLGFPGYVYVMNFGLREAILSYVE